LTYYKINLAKYAKKKLKTGLGPAYGGMVGERRSPYASTTIDAIPYARHAVVVGQQIWVVAGNALSLIIAKHGKLRTKAWSWTWL
jgi:hypothetical protein